MEISITVIRWSAGIPRVEYAYQPIYHATQYTGKAVVNASVDMDCLPGELLGIHIQTNWTVKVPHLCLSILRYN
jgi:hypothetical protein